MNFTDIKANNSFKLLSSSPHPIRWAHFLENETDSKIQDKVVSIRRWKMAGEDVFPYPLVVEGKWDLDVAKLLKNKLQIYFQSRKQCDGGECVVEYEDLASNQAVVRFASDQSA